MRTIRLAIDLTYDDELMHGDDPAAIAWFCDVLLGDDLRLGEFGELGDMIGPVRVVSPVPAALQEQET